MHDYHERPTRYLADSVHVNSLVGILEESPWCEWTIVIYASAPIRGSRRRSDGSCISVLNPCSNTRRSVGSESRTDRNTGEGGKNTIDGTVDALRMRVCNSGKLFITDSMSFDAVAESFNMMPNDLILGVSLARIATSSSVNK